MVNHKLMSHLLRDLLLWQQDRRWRNMAHGEKQLKEQGKQPQTAQEHLDAMAHYGFHPVFTLSAAQRAQKMRFDQFASACGGFTTRDDYPAKDEPDAPTKCEKCSKEGELTVIELPGCVWHWLQG
jgi:hypothetical protein